MEGKLIKRKNGDYNLKIKNSTFATTNQVLRKQNNIKELSLKNCQAIENGYDLDELVKNMGKEFYVGGNYDFENGVKEGFLKALKILGDKKFSEKELTMLFAYGHQIGMNDVLAIQSQHSPQPMPKPDSDKLRDELIQSLQQTEFDVEIEMNIIPELLKGSYPEEKLDDNGCLILKRK